MKTLSFDVWNTLVKSNPESKKIRNELLSEMFRMPVDKIYPIYIHVDRAIEHESEINGKHFGFEERIDIISRVVGRYPSPADLSEAHYNNDVGVMHNPPVLIDPLTPEFFKRWVGRGHQILLLSNTGFADGEIMRSALNSIGIMEYVSWAGFSNEIGYAKPSPIMYGAIRSHAEHDLVHIGDNWKADVEGALKSGIEVAHFNPTWDGLAPHDCYGGKMLHSVRSLAEVEETYGL
jgi:putative hydrolase of the HAD superfamily